MRLVQQRSAQPLRFIMILILIYVLIDVTPFTVGCPDRCVCNDQLVVQCAEQYLTVFPSNIPLPTRKLIISNNRLVELPPLMLYYLSDLVHLDCSNNSLTWISDATFGNLRKLAYLDISFNNLSRIESRTFLPLVSLVMLRMTDNYGLSMIHPLAFKGNENLQLLDVSRNNLTVLDVSILSNLPDLRYIAISGNPWNCRCDNEELSIWANKEGFRFPDKEQAFCRSPPSMQEQRIDQVSLQMRAVHKPGHTFGYLYLISCLMFQMSQTAVITLLVMHFVTELSKCCHKLDSEDCDDDSSDGSYQDDGELNSLLSVKSS
ncbi:leucine-rich repeat-containing protein 38-like [Osmerus mordax]|uniref:leucine-rich repeat-containing protein 38-like n=1 Tax=Osmerus mordax TaxID=8014 RepID=UPI00350F1C3F